MDAKQAYDFWASLYDSNKNNTRDLEAVALRKTLEKINFSSCLEIGCGTGKNTSWLLQYAKTITAVDLSPAMLLKAREKIKAQTVEFVEADIREDWQFAKSDYDLISFSLVLEHIEYLEPVFQKSAEVLKPGGYVYIGELHPFKQYTGTKARFDTEEGKQVVECYTHHISDFIQAATKYGLIPVDINEFFDTPDRNEIPRILTILLKKDV
jgi:ubiquinone/menaquinone biosynthesis C-methylase UbiE